MSGLPANYNIAIYQGQTLNLTFVWTTGACSCETGVPVGQTPTAVDLTGYTAVMQFCAWAGGTLLYDASADLTLGGTAGTIQLFIPATVTEGFTWWNAVYDLFLTSSQGVATALIAGNVAVTASVST